MVGYICSENFKIIESHCFPFRQQGLDSAREPMYLSVKRQNGDTAPDTGGQRPQGGP